MLPGMLDLAGHHCSAVCVHEQAGTGGTEAERGVSGCEFEQAVHRGIWLER